MRFSHFHIPSKIEIDLFLIDTYVTNFFSYFTGICSLSFLLICEFKHVFVSICSINLKCQIHIIMISTNFTHNYYCDLFYLLSSKPTLTTLVHLLDLTLAVFYILTIPFDITFDMSLLYV